MAGPEKTDAIVLKTQQWSESSKIAHLYTRNWGRISILAKGAMRPKARFWGHLETFSLIEAMVYKKSRERLHLLSQSNLKDPFGGLYTDPMRAGYGFAVVEFLERHTFEEANNDLFEWTTANFSFWQTITGTRLTLAFYEYLLVALSLLGYQPVMDACRSCGRVAEPGKKALFDREGGGVICRRCASANGTYMMVSAPAYERLKKLLSEAILFADDETVANGLVDEIGELTEAFYGYHLGGGRLKSLDFVRRVAGPAPE